MSHKLLLADDSITIQKVVGIIFSGEEYDLTVVDNGTAALERAREIVPDVMLVDALMPGKNGYEVCQEVRNDPVLASVPILLLTGVFEPFDEVKAIDSGADDFIAKPFESQALISKVKELLVQGNARKSTAAAAVTPPVPGQFFPVAETAGAETTTAAMALSVGQQSTEPPFSPSPPTAPAIIPEEVEPLEIVEVTSADDLWGMGVVDEEPREEIPFGTVFEEKEGEALEGIEELEPFVFEEEPLPPQVTYDFAVVPERSGEGLMFDTQPAPEATPPAADKVVPEFPVLQEMVAIEIGAPVGAGEEPEGFVFEEDDSLMPPDEIEEPFALEEPVVAASLPSEIEDVLPIIDVTEETAVEVVPTFVGLAPAGAPASPPVAETGVSGSPATATAALTEEQLITALSKVSREVIERIVWEVVPDLAEALIKEEIRKIRESV